MFINKIQYYHNCACLRFVSVRKYASAYTHFVSVCDDNAGATFTGAGATAASATEYNQFVDITVQVTATHTCTATATYQWAVFR